MSGDIEISHAKATVGSNTTDHEDNGGSLATKDAGTRAGIARLKPQ